MEINEIENRKAIGKISENKRWFFEKRNKIDKLLARLTRKREKTWASLVVQWLRICLPMQGTRVRALVWEDPTCRGATRPVSHNY